MSSRIVLTTLNATYFHCAFGLRYLMASLGELETEARLVEFTLAENPRDIVEAILSEAPEIVGFGVYVWNARQTLDVVAILKRVRPEVVVVLGGPEVSYETEAQPLAHLADIVIKGEAERLFADMCRDYFRTGTLPPLKFLSGALPDLTTLPSPYRYYDDEDLRHRVLYVEASRGCPYRCEFCLSSLDKSVRPFPLEPFLADMERLLERGARQFKFVDRTFNLSPVTSARILGFFLERMRPGLFLHFEMVPDRLPQELRDLIRRFPSGTLQFEIGIQTWSPEVARRVSRRQDYGKIRENFAFLTGETGVHLHADLIAGLPGETVDTFGEGFNAVAALGPQEIQVGILKRLKGTPIARHETEWALVYDEAPPFPILSTRTMAFSEVQELSRFAKFWDLYANSGNFRHTMELFRNLAARRERPSQFAELREFFRFLSQRHKQRHGIALQSLVESAWRYLSEHELADREEVRAALIRDYTGYVKRDVPGFLRETSGAPVAAPRKRGLPERQQRHVL